MPRIGKVAMPCTGLTNSMRVGKKSFCNGESDDGHFYGSVMYAFRYGLIEVTTHYKLNDSLIPTIIIPVPMMARISPMSLPMTLMMLSPSFLTMKSLMVNAQ